MTHLGRDGPITQEIFEDPIVQLAALCPICALSALSPAAALAALSSSLRVFNPAINPYAALLSFSLDWPQVMLAHSIQASVLRTFQQNALRRERRGLFLYPPAYL